MEIISIIDILLKNIMFLKINSITSVKEVTLIFPSSNAKLVVRTSKIRSGFYTFEGLENENGSFLGLYH